MKRLETILRLKKEMGYKSMKDVTKLIWGV